MEEDKAASNISEEETICSVETVQVKGEGSNGKVVFSREAPLVHYKDLIAGGCSCGVNKIKSRLENSDSENEKSVPEKKLSRQDRIELGRLFQGAVSGHDWELAESLILLADPQTLNDTLCIALDSIWFLTSQEELYGITGLIKKIIGNGAFDFTRAVLRTSFLASCVSACQSRTMSLANTVTAMAQSRLHERLQECNGDEVLKVEAGAKVQKFTEWALKCIGYHSRCQGKRYRVGHNSAIEIQLQLSAFKTFLDLAGNHLTGKDFTEAFDAACFPLTLFSSSFDTGWATGVSATAIQGLLSMLVEGGADNVNQCFLEASRFGSTELVRILLQIAQRNSLDVDVDLALGFASHYGKIGTMECLVEEGNAMAFLGPLMRAAERGSLQVVEWFVKRGCRDMELCLALTAATSSSQVEVAAYLLPHVPQHILAALSIEILKAAGERSGGSLDGVAFLLHSDFLGDPVATYAVADSIAKSDDDDAVTPNLKSFLQEHWSEAAFFDGLRQGQEHYLNLVRIVKWSECPICLKDLPGPLRVAIAYLPLYRESIKAGGCLLSQRLRGQLVEAAKRLGGVILEEANQGKELLAVLEHHLPPFLLNASSAAYN
ncbi:ankyrin repeat protein SKIP35-like isoform X1 [Nicotiana sylvestris]|uniref:Ankyrin repeat protein SKIP35 isoform X1 n=2 Tax=Nicotiana TaxID=4085 RepID=A0A1S4AMQ8_TOBAC|nr:PREDICTED: ankyrin repeat protein SKIP35-like isoform X1 [Nicotiana sylvestris]XP_009797821.1 PREDICTED: ankyrin repeat protein SKIP35-like isoform X1 [Nicotiana sylvestris]XP_009797822.1 PREDICTED: ankyrin repeat protein SKIP35-like isoform X1 [Nicotiana sylvestris]XP_016477897.1 PREDICTED: ankyrin repeat protein SKIP35-like isoform X1 [Nicotiana tabacum]XP_016477898.1 PREDICTED: ankyrin repeat protein SKIP35-like isoform X1 [Nicotiana tabacum]XP_016477900.1 PREDICTED: ankyrin repeat prote